MSHPISVTNSDPVEVGTLDELWEGEMVESSLPDGSTCVILNIGGTICAYEGSCPHAGSPLGEMGYFDGEKLVCGAHAWEFDARSGEGLNPRGASLVRLPVEVQDGVIFVGPVDGPRERNES